jgi:hypothetical protein
MVEILSHLHQYVPAKEFKEDVYIPSTGETVTLDKAALSFFGDQLTEARARGAISAMCNAVSPIKRLEGLIPAVSDWHAEVVILKVKCTKASNN